MKSRQAIECFCLMMLFIGLVQSGLGADSYSYVVELVENSGQAVIVGRAELSRKEGVKEEPPGSESLFGSQYDILVKFEKCSFPVPTMYQPPAIETAPFDLDLVDYLETLHPTGCNGLIHELVLSESYWVADSAPTFAGVAGHDSTLEQESSSSRAESRPTILRAFDNLVGQPRGSEQGSTFREGRSALGLDWATVVRGIKALLSRRGGQVATPSKGLSISSSDDSSSSQDGAAQETDEGVQSRPVATRKRKSTTAPFEDNRAKRLKNIQSLVQAIEVPKKETHILRMSDTSLADAIIPFQQRISLEMTKFQSCHLEACRETYSPKNVFKCSRGNYLEPSILLSPFTYRNFSYLPAPAPGHKFETIVLGTKTLWPMNWGGGTFDGGLTDSSACATTLEVSGEIAHFFIRTDEGVIKSKFPFRINCHTFTPTRGFIELKSCSIQDAYPPYTWEYRSKGYVSPHAKGIRFTRLVDPDYKDINLPAESLLALPIIRTTRTPHRDEDRHAQGDSPVNEEKPVGGQQLPDRDSLHLALLALYVIAQHPFPMTLTPNYPFLMNSLFLLRSLLINARLPYFPFALPVR